MRDSVLWQNDSGTQRVDTVDGLIRMSDVRRITTGDEVDPKDAGVKLMGRPTWRDGTPKKLVWVQLAEVGTWKGHGAGAFSLTPTTFSEICANHARRGLPIPFDYEHASEQEPTQGSIPQGGAPAPGWTHKLDNRGIGGLWGLVEWLDEAREKIQEGAYAFLSPAIRFDSKDGKTGAPVGAKLTSVAITNQPFLTGLGALVAAKDGQTAPVVSMRAGLDQMVGNAHEYLPKIRAALRVHDLTPAAELGDHLDRLRECCMSAGPSGMHEGNNLGDYTEPLRAICGAGPADKWDDVFDRVQDMIDAAIDAHNADPNAHSLKDADPSAQTTAGIPGTETTTMPTEAELQIQLKDANTKAGAAEGRATAAESKVTTLTGEKDGLTTQLKDVTARADKAEATLKDILGAVTLRGDETVTTAIKRIVDENAALLKDKAKRDEEDLRFDVEQAFDTYKDVKKLTDKDKVAMTQHAKDSRASFNATYPPVPASERHLLMRLVKDEKRPEKDVTEQSVTARAKEILASDSSMTWTQAQDRATKELREATGAAG